MKVIVGLGNPGSRYARTRHNAGFWVVDRLAERWGWKLSDREFRARLARGSKGGEKIVLLEPQTYMNESGDSVGRARRKLRVDPADFLLVYDELDLPLGRLRLRPTGGPGGHRGVASVLSALGSKDVPRVRLGIGRPLGGRDPTDFVLERPETEERPILSELVERAADAVELILDRGFDVAMNQFNGAEASER